MQDRDRSTSRGHPIGLVDQIQYYANQRSSGVELHRFILRHGREFVGPLWRRPFKARSKLCYENAITAALTHDNLNYAEGFVWSPEVPILIEHGWCVDSAGMPVELTLVKTHYSEVRYYGVVLLQGYVEELLKHGSIGRV